MQPASKRRQDFARIGQRADRGRQNIDDVFQLLRFFDAVALNDVFQIRFRKKVRQILDLLCFRPHRSD